MRDVLTLQHEVATAIAQRIEFGFDRTGGSTDAKSMSRVPQVPNADALQACLKGRYHFNRVGLGVHDALQYYQQAIEIDPEFALAHAAFAEACWQPPIIMSGTLPFSRCAEAADRAVEHDAGLAEAQAAVGFIRVLQWDWSTAAEHLKRALAINPNSIMANTAYAELLRTTMRVEEALIVMRRAEQLDPLNLFVKTMVGWPLYYLRRYDEAIEQWNQVVEVDSGYWLAHYNLGLAFIALGNARPAPRASEVPIPARRGLKEVRIGFEETVRHLVSVGLQAAAPRFAIVSGLPVTLGCRMYKSAAEIALMKKASEVALNAYRHVYGNLQSGMTSDDVKAMMADQREVWQTVCEGQRIAFETAKIGTPASAVDDAVRAYYESLGYGPGYQRPG